MPHLKLIKLMYLAERLFLERYDMSMTGDEAYNLDHGPILSGVLDLINGNLLIKTEQWTSLISEKNNNEVSLKNKINVEDLDELSPADIEILEATWEKFGRYNKWELRELTHLLPEYEEPEEGSRLYLPLLKILGALGKSEELANKIREDIEDQRRIDRLLAAN